MAGGIDYFSQWKNIIITLYGSDKLTQKYKNHKIYSYYWMIKIVVYLGSSKCDVNYYSLPKFNGLHHHILIKLLTLLKSMHLKMKGIKLQGKCLHLL